MNFEFFPYQRPFNQPLQTNHGIWKLREGIIVRLEDQQGNLGWGEIAPLPWFGSETLTEAKAFCQQLKPKITSELIKQIPDNLPCCQFAFQSALDELNSQDDSELLTDLKYSYLLPTGEKALQQIKTIVLQPESTFKWKIGVNSLAQERELFEQLIQLLPPNSKLRLDANGGLTYQEAQVWLSIAQRSGKVEFIEQPLPTEQLNLMLELANNYSTLLALDESVATLNQLDYCRQQGWQGVFVIKPCIAGYPQKLQEFCLTHKLDIVLSSVLETTIGRKIALRLAQKIQNLNRAIGFGVAHWFDDMDRY
jgi:O-succinylbenzoate synthase